MADRNDDQRARPPLPPTPEFAEARYIEPEDMRVGYPPLCTQIDEGPEKDLAFLNSMAPEVAQKYRGEWIAVVDGKVAAHGKDPELVCEAGRKAGKGEGPLMEYIYATPEEVPWLGIPH